MIAGTYDINAKGGAADAWLMDVVRWTWRVKFSLSLALDLMTEMRERAEEEAIHVFARNLKDLLLAAPAGSRATMGLDPGIRTGVKVAVVDGTGKLLDTATVYPFQPRNDVRGAQTELAGLIRKHKVELIAIGNGTASRETDKLVADMIGLMPPPKPIKVIVERGGRVGLFGLGGRVGGVPQSRRVAARRGFDRAAPAGSAGRTGEDRAEIDRRRAISARCRPAQAGQGAGWRGRRRRERRRRRSEHRLGARCWRASPGLAPRSRKPSSPIATISARSRHARSC